MWGRCLAQHPLLQEVLLNEKYQNIKTCLVLLLVSCCLCIWYILPWMESHLERSNKQWSEERPCVDQRGSTRHRSAAPLLSALIPRPRTPASWRLCLSSPAPRPGSPTTGSCKAVQRRCFCLSLFTGTAPQASTPFPLHTDGSQGTASKPPPLRGRYHCYLSSPHEGQACPQCSARTVLFNLCDPTMEL